MSRRTFYQSLQPNGLTNEDGTASLMPVFSSQASYPPRSEKYMDLFEIKKIISPVDIGGFERILAILFIRPQLNNSRLQKIKDETGKMIDNPDPRMPVIGRLCRDVLEIIIHFGLGVSADFTGNYKNTRGEFTSVSRQSHLIERAFFERRPKFISSEDGAKIFLAHVLHDLITAVKNDDREQAEYILKKNPMYLTLSNSDGVTALEMALRTDNPVMVKMMETYFFDETKIHDGKAIMMRQFNTAFPQGYEAHCTQQKADAKQLFMNAGIIDANGKSILFNGVSPQDIDNTLNKTPQSDSIVKPRLDNFKALLAKYYQTHVMHNDEILALADDIYFENFDYWIIEKLRVFSDQFIGAIQEKDRQVSLFRLKNHAQGIYNLATEVASDSFCLRGTSDDVRSLRSLGVDCCIDICGDGSGRARRGRSGGMEPGTCTFRKIMSTKNKMLSDVMQRCHTQPQRAKVPCCVM